MYINRKHHVKKINNYKELEVFIEEANKRDLDIVSVLKDDNAYVVIYKSINSVTYEIR